MWEGRPDDFIFFEFSIWRGGWEEEEGRGNWQALRRGRQESGSIVLFSLLFYFHLGLGLDGCEWGDSGRIRGNWHFGTLAQS